MGGGDGGVVHFAKSMALAGPVVDAWQRICACVDVSAL